MRNSSVIFYSLRYLGTGIVAVIVTHFLLKKSGSLDAYSRFFVPPKSVPDPLASAPLRKIIKDRRSDGKTPLHDVVERRDVAEFNRLLNSKHDDINKKEYETGYTPFYLAIRLNEKEMVSYALASSRSNQVKVNLRTTRLDLIEKAPHLLVQFFELSSIEAMLTEMFKLSPEVLSDDSSILYLFLDRIQQLASEHAEANCTMPFHDENLDEVKKEFIASHTCLLLRVLTLLVNNGANVNAINNHQHLLTFMMSYGFPPEAIRVITIADRFDKDLFLTQIQTSRKDSAAFSMLSYNGTLVRYEELLSECGLNPGRHTVPPRR